MAWAIIKVGYGCNNNCTFCHSADLRALALADRGPAELQHCVSEAAAAGFEGIWLSGGEPTLRPDLLAVARRAASLKLGFGLISNGRRLSYPDYCGELIAAGLSRVHLSLHGPAVVHDALVRVAGAFGQTFAAVEHLAAVPGLDLTVNTVVCLNNIDVLEALLKVLPDHGVRWKLSSMEPRGAVLGNPATMPHPELASAAVRRALAAAVAAGFKRSLLAWEGLPFCFMSGWEDAHYDLLAAGIVALREVGEAGFPPVDYLNMSRTKGCGACTESRCRGWWSRGWEVFPGAVAVRPYS